MAALAIPAAFLGANLRIFADHRVGMQHCSKRSAAKATKIIDDDRYLFLHLKKMARMRKN